MDFKSCEVLIVDAEGQDAAVLRSMITHCRAREHLGFSEWPSVIQFETMGHCDKREGAGAEWGVISYLQQVGYVVVAYSNYNTYLAHNMALVQIRAVQNWAGPVTCKSCWDSTYPYVFGANGVHCERCAGIVVD